MTELPTAEDRGDRDAWQVFKQAICREQGWQDDCTDAVVLSHLDRLARQTACRFPKHIKEHLVEDGVQDAIMEILYQFSDQDRSPSGWFCTVLRNDGIDKIRRKMRRPEAGMPTDELEQQISPWVDAAETAPEALASLRKSPIYVAAFPESALDVDLYLLFVLDYRLKVSLKAGLGLPYAERRLAWEPRETMRRIKAGWPRMADLWATVIRQNCDTYLKAREQLFAWCNERLSDTTEQIDGVKWNQWIRRAKSLIRRIAVGDWETYFDRMYPTRESRRPSEPECGDQP